MKNLFLAVLASLALYSCDWDNRKDEPGRVYNDSVVDVQYVINHPGEFDKACLDSNKIDKNKMCNTEFKPVCGCNGITYSNSCKATIAGVLNYTEGKCPGGD